MTPTTQNSSNTRSEDLVAERCVLVSGGKPTFTRPSSVQPNYVASKSKTNPRVLHQPRALKAPAADKARDRSETGGGSGASRKLAGNMVEVSGAAKAAPVTSVRSRDGEIGRKAKVSSRVFVLGKSGQPLMPCHPARASLTAHGFPRGYLSPKKSHFGFRTGDVVAAAVTKGVHRGVHHGRVAVRASGSFNIQTKCTTVQGIAHRFCSILQRADGYAYAA